MQTCIKSIYLIRRGERRDRTEARDEETGTSNQPVSPGMSINFINNNK